MDAAFKVVIGLILTVLILATVKGCEDCQSRGGVYVKGVFFYECVNKR